MPLILHHMSACACVNSWARSLHLSSAPPTRAPFPLFPFASHPLQAKNKDVRARVRERIVGTYLRVDTTGVLTKRAAWESFIGKLMGKIRALIDDVK